MEYNPVVNTQSASLMKSVSQLLWARDFTDQELKMLESIMVSCIYHEGAPSIEITKLTAKAADNDLMAVSAGLMSLGHKHGGAIQDLAYILQTKEDKNPYEIITQYILNNQKIPGFGHRMYKDQDPRALNLLQISKELNLPQENVLFTLELEQRIEKMKGKKLPLNIDGAIAAIISDLNLPWQSSNFVFFWPRMAGLLYAAQMDKNKVDEGNT